MNALYHVQRTKKICLARPWSTAALIHAADRALLAEDDGTTGQSTLILRMADEDTGNIRDCVLARHGSNPIR
jgi:hypothetical protein